MSYGYDNDNDQLAMTMTLFCMSKWMSATLSLIRFILDF
jgi:hypothetical protein